jgi:2-polyprenyl-6-methoxyphenol hydroxylase-like FAD-dependent oxidoreductase
MAAEQVSTRCCIVGGGPCGMMLGFLLARAGVDVVVLEKHADFLRDFRGDTIHPSTLEVMAELGLLDAFLKLPHQKQVNIGAVFSGHEYAFADFSHLPTRCKFIALMPQWDFLDFLAQYGKRYPGFHLRMRAEAVDLVVDGGRVIGVRAATPGGPLEVRADLTVGCDGRHSTVRERAGLRVEDIGAPMDVLWFRLSRKPNDPDESMGRFDPGRMVVLLDRGDYWQCAFLIPKGSIEETKRAGLPAFRQTVARVVPPFADRVDELKDWEQVKLLTVAVNRLERWYRPGLLCIGDAAHAMSPVGGVGINLAIADAVAAAGLLARPLRTHRLTTKQLATVRRRRLLPTAATQTLQRVLHRVLLASVLQGHQAARPPAALLNLLERVPQLTAVPAYIIGVGLLPQHAPDFARR